MSFADSLLFIPVPLNSKNYTAGCAIPTQSIHMQYQLIEWAPSWQNKLAESPFLGSVYETMSWSC